MARKRSDLESASKTEAPTDPTPKPTRARRTRKTDPEPPAAQPEATEAKAVTAEPAARRRRAVKATAVEPPHTPSPHAPSADAPAPDAPAAEEKPKSRRRRAAPAQAPSPEPSTEIAPAEAAKPARSRRKKATAEMPVTRPADPAAETVEDDLPVPTWRPRQRPAPRVAADASDRPAATSEDEERTGRRRGRRRGRGAERTPETADAALREAVEMFGDAEDLVPQFRPVGGLAAPAPPRERAPKEAPATRAPKPAEPPAEEVKPMIPIPADAPQIVLREGVPTLVRDQRVYPPIMFFGSPSDERRAATVLDELRMAAEAGIHLHSHLIDLEVHPGAVDDAAAFAAYMLKQSVEIDPQSQVVFRLVFVSPKGWQDKYPDARYRTEDGSLAEPSVCDDAYWDVARSCLDSFVRKMRKLDLRDHILGVHLERGEWFYPEGWGYDDSVAAKRKFREWARRRYLNDEVALRASLFDGTARFDTLSIPPYQPEGAEGDKFVRSSRKQRRYVDYHLFISDETVHLIGELAYTVKQASEGNFLVGVSYGYTFEWSHPASGHLSLGKLLRTPEVDFVAGPPSYRNREPGGAAPFPGPIDSFALNGKLYISEEDFKTSLSAGQEPDAFNPVIKTPQALESVQWRGAGAALAHGSGVCWMDLWGNGWLKTPKIWTRGTKVAEALTTRMGAPPADPEVAIFIDERALAYLVDPNAFTLLVQNVRESILRAGVSAAFYLLSDLAHRERFPESKLYLFLNAWDIRQELRAAIKSRLQREGKVLFWLYAAGLFDAGRESLERAREVTGIALKPQPFYSKSGTTILNRRHPLSEAFPDRTLIGGTKLEPSYFAIPEDALVLGEYTQTGLPSFVVKEHQEGSDRDSRWTSVFLGEPLVNPALIRALAQMAGVHVWNFQEDVVHVRPPFCTVHCSGTGPRTLTLPDKFSAYNLLAQEWAAVDSTNLRFTGLDGSTHLFLVGLKEELEHYLSLDPEDLLRMAELPPREANVRSDVSNFEVPIVKLDEWIGGAEPDDVADEWFLRPHQVLDEEPAAEQATQERPGRRRRRRRGGRDRVGSEESTYARPEPSGSPEMFVEELDLNVMFRRKE
jgi:hypothetical protein